MNPIWRMQNGQGPSWRYAQAKIESETNFQVTTLFPGNDPFQRIYAPFSVTGRFVKKTHNFAQISPKMEP
jgi:hypothetical protein